MKVYFDASVLPSAGQHVTAAYIVSEFMQLAFAYLKIIQVDFIACDA